MYMPKSAQAVRSRQVHVSVSSCFFQLKQLMLLEMEAVSCQWVYC